MKQLRFERHNRMTCSWSFLIVWKRTVRKDKPMAMHPTFDGNPAKQLIGCLSLKFIIPLFADGFYTSEVTTIWESLRFPSINNEMRFGNIWKYHKLPSPRTCWHFGWWKNHLKHQSRIEETKTSDEKKQLDTLCKTPIQNGCLEFSISLWYFRWTQEQGSLYYQPKQYIRQFNDAISGWCYPNLPISRIQLPTETAFLGGFNITSTRPCQFCRKKNVDGLRRVAILQRLWVPQTAIPKSHKGSASKKFNASWGSRIWLFFCLLVSDLVVFFEKQSHTWKRKTSPGHINVTSSCEGENIIN